jgi:hypothetical protein
VRLSDRLKVNSVLKRFEQLQIVDRDQCGNWPAVPCEHETLTAVGNPIDDVGLLIAQVTDRNGVCWELASSG